MRGAWKQLSRTRTGMAGLVLTSIVVLMALAAPWLATHDPLATGPATFQPPGDGGWLGTDHLGRDVWSGIVYGSRVSLLVGISASALSTVIGIAVGALAGYRGGWLDVLLMRMTEFFQIVPQFFLALVLVAILSRGIEKVIIVLGILGWPLTARLVRGEFLALREREFVEAARALGMKPGRLIMKVLLPNALPPVIITATQGVAAAILLEAGVSFFGLGDPNLVSWGLMLNTAQGFLRRAWWMSIMPGLAIFIAALGFTLLGDGLNEILNPRLRRQSQMG